MSWTLHIRYFIYASPPYCIYIHETLFSWFVISCSIILTLQNYWPGLNFRVSMLSRIYAKMNSSQIKSFFFTSNWREIGVRVHHVSVQIWCDRMCVKFTGGRDHINPTYICIKSVSRCFYGFVFPYFLHRLRFNLDRVHRWSWCLRNTAAWSLGFRNMPNDHWFSSFILCRTLHTYLYLCLFYRAVTCICTFWNIMLHICKCINLLNKLSNRHR